MRTALTTFRAELTDPDGNPAPGPLVVAGEAFTADHPVVLAHPDEFGPDDPDPDATPAPTRARKAT